MRLPIVQTDEEVLKDFENKREEYRRKLFGTFLTPLKYRVSRHKIFDQLMEIYKDENVAKQLVSFELEDENASGDGVDREVFGFFWDAFFMKYGEGYTEFIIPGHPDLNPDKLLVLGRVLTHQFLVTGTFPLQLSRAALQNSITGKVTDEDLLHSFLLTLPIYEREELEKALANKQFDAKKVENFLCVFKMTQGITSTNIKAVLKDMATYNIITQPFGSMLSIRQGMGEFWKKVTNEDVRAMYSLSAPTKENLLNNLMIEDTTAQEQKVGVWLTRYIYDADADTLQKFARFCTGTSFVSAMLKTCVKFLIVPEAVLSLRSKTCVRVLYVPSNYHSFHQLRNNFNTSIRDTERWDLQD